MYFPFSKYGRKSFKAVEGEEIGSWDMEIIKGVMWNEQEAMAVDVDIAMVGAMT